MSNAAELGVSPPQAEEADELATIIAQALTLSPAHMQEWMATLGREHFRAVRRQERLAGGLGIIKMGQWFGGASVPLAGITAVGIAPEQRGKGAAGALMKAVLAEMYAEGYPLSALYPATVTLYRRYGYELAGSKLVHEVSLHSIDFRDRSLEVVPAGPEDLETIQQLYTQRAALSNGNLDRTSTMWDRALKARDKTVLSYLIVRDGSPEGYVTYFAPLRNEPLEASEVCVLSRDAGRRALTMLADHRSVIKSVYWRGAPQDPLLHLLTEQDTYKVRERIEWMLRIINVPAALQARGYPAGLSAELHFDIRDELLPQNNGRFVLELADGEASVRSGGRGTLRIDIHGLAALYSSYLTPQALRILGQLEGSQQELQTAGLVFSGPRPWIVEMF